VETVPGKAKPGRRIHALSCASIRARAFGLFRTRAVPPAVGA
jgi:hypothetical protein